MNKTYKSVITIDFDIGFDPSEHGLDEVENSIQDAIEHPVRERLRQIGGTTSVHVDVKLTEHKKRASKRRVSRRRR